MIEFKIDSDNTALFIIFRNNIDANQTEELYNSLQQIVPKLKRNFQVLTDLSFMKRMDFDAHLFIEKIMLLCNQHGVSRIIRVIPDGINDVGFNIMSIFNYSPSVRVVTYKSSEDAFKNFF